jgi:hypothetical protein
VTEGGDCRGRGRRCASGKGRRNPSQNGGARRTVGPSGPNPLSWVRPNLQKRAKPLKNKKGQNVGPGRTEVNPARVLGCHGLGTGVGTSCPSLSCQCRTSLAGFLPLSPPPPCPYPDILILKWFPAKGGREGGRGGNERTHKFNSTHLYSFVMVNQNTLSHPLTVHAQVWVIARSPLAFLVSCVDALVIPV